MLPHKRTPRLPQTPNIPLRSIIHLRRSIPQLRLQPVILSMVTFRSDVRQCDNAICDNARVYVRLITSLHIRGTAYTRAPSGVVSHRQHSPARDGT